MISKTTRVDLAVPSSVGLSQWKPQTLYVRLSGWVSFAPSHSKNECPREQCRSQALGNRGLGLGRGAKILRYCSVITLFDTV
jgi:hypothetical protein